MFRLVFFFDDPASTEIYTLSLHDALPISSSTSPPCTSAAAEPTKASRSTCRPGRSRCSAAWSPARGAGGSTRRSEEHTSELQSRVDLVCRLLLEKKKNNKADCA